MIKFILFCLFILLQCKDIDDKKKNETQLQKNNFIFFSLFQNRDKGNCLRVEKIATGNSLSCDRKPAGLCNTNDLITTSGERINNLNQGSKFIELNPSCRDSFAFSGIALDKVQTFAEEDTIKANNNFFSVNSCETLEIPATVGIINLIELEFINSAKGRIGISADRLINTPERVLSQSLPVGSNLTQIKKDATTCLNTPFSKSEVDLIIALRTGTILRQFSCAFNSTTSPCPDKLNQYK
jgi:hypothetical protein